MKVEIKYDRFGKGTYPHTISITHNGSQWVGISVSSLDELRQLQREIDKYIDSAINSHGNSE